jgi:hypothetical protein
VCLAIASEIQAPMAIVILCGLTDVDAANTMFRAFFVSVSRRQ